MDLTQRFTRNSFRLICAVEFFLVAIYNFLKIQEIVLYLHHDIITAWFLAEF